MLGQLEGWRNVTVHGDLLVLASTPRRYAMTHNSASTAKEANDVLP